jgi:hypothetical protein
MGEELLPRLGGHHRRYHHIWRRRRPTPINKWGSVPRQEASPGNRQCGGKPHLVDGEAQLEAA